MKLLILYLSLLIMGCTSERAESLAEFQELHEQGWQPCTEDQEIEFLVEGKPRRNIWCLYKDGKVRISLEDNIIIAGDRISIEGSKP